MVQSTAKKIKGRFQPVQMGLGEAVRRLIQVEFAFRSGIGTVPEQLLDEREMLLEALNVIPIDIGFDCNADGVPDTVEIFKQAASTSCCRLMPPGSKAPAKRKPKAPAKRKASKPKPKTKAAAKKKTAKKGVLRRLLGSGESE